MSSRQIKLRKVSSELTASGVVQRERTAREYRQAERAARRCGVLQAGAGSYRREWENRPERREMNNERASQ